MSSSRFRRWFRFLGNAAVGLLLVMSVAPAAYAQPENRPVAVEMPAPTGDFPIGVADLHMVDARRDDPWVPARHRELMVRIWYPAVDSVTAETIPWMSSAALRTEEHALAARGVSPGSWRLGAGHSHAQAAARLDAGAFPVLLFSPGMDDPVGWYTAQAEDLASHGYVVVGINHTHEAFWVEFPGGRFEGTRVPLDSPKRVQTDLLLPTRVADTRFVLDQLSEISRRGSIAGQAIPAGLAESIDLSRVGMYGASLGGATTVQAMHDDPRILAGVNLDGPIMGSVLADGVDRPLLMMGSEEYTWGVERGWGTGWPTNTGSKTLRWITGARHWSYTDQQVILPQLATVGLMSPERTEKAVGSVDPARSLALQRLCLQTYFDTVFNGGNIDNVFASVAPAEVRSSP